MFVFLRVAILHRFYCIVIYMLFTLSLLIYFVQEMWSAYPSAAYIQMHSRLSKHYEPWSDCSLREQSDLGPFCLRYRLPTYISRRESRRQLLRKAGKGIIWSHMWMNYRSSNHNFKHCRAKPYLTLKGLTALWKAKSRTQQS